MAKLPHTVFGIITFISLLLADLLHGIWTVWIVIEQVKTGWGYGTDMDILALVPWIVELVCLPAVILGIIYLAVMKRSIPKKLPKGLPKSLSRGKLYRLNGVMLWLLLLQYALFNLFLHF